MTADAASSSTTFRVFVSSTFEDFKEERNALQKYVFPRLQELCARHQARFQAIDLRWGVSTEAGLDQRTVQICLEEIARCQRLTPRPNFIILLGDRYGWRPLPAWIEKSEFEAILAKVPESDRELLLWTEKQSKDRMGWYRLDLNADPAEYILMPREVVLAKDATDDERKAAQEAEEKRWCEIEHRLRVILLAAIDKLGWGKEDPIRFKYLASATEQEILRGALEVLDAAEHVFGFSRTIYLKNDNPLEKPKPLAENVPPDGKAQNFLDEVQVDGGWAPDGEAHARLVALKDRLDTLLGDNLSNYKATWTGSGISLDYIGDLPDTLDKCLELLKRADLPKTLCNDAWRNLAGIILSQLKQLESMEAVKAEIDAHERFGIDRRRNFVGREEPLQAIAKYLAANDPQPLTVIGDPGSGKSALMAKAVEQARAAHPKAVTVVRFIGATPGSSDGRSLLGNLCRQITRAYGADESTVPTEYNDLAVEFGKRLELATANRPLIIFLDALDQLGKSDPARALSWLPTNLPNHVRLVVSTLPGDCEAILRNKHPEPQLVELRAMQASEGEELLGLWLETAKRKLQEPQRKEVLGKFAGCGLPLYLKLAFEEARLWYSFSEPAQTVLYEGIPALISDNLFRRLAKPASHGELFVSHALGYLAASRYGLSEDELLDVLSADEEVKADFLQRSPRSPNVDRLPVVVWSRLYFDLEPYLSEHAADGTTLLTFYHNQLREAVTTQFLAEEEGRARHAALATYFRGKADPASDKTWTGKSLRGLSETPYHLAGAERLDELYETLTDFHFLEHKVAEVGITEHIGADGKPVKTYGGVYLLQDDFGLALVKFGGGSEAGRRKPLIVTAVDFGKGLVVRCPWCNKQSPFNKEWRGADIACPQCQGPLRVNKFVVGESMFEKQ
jgi:hypothetical protein